MLHGLFSFYVYRIHQNVGFADQFLYCELTENIMSLPVPVS